MNHADGSEIRALAEAVADVLEERGFLTPSAPAPGIVLTVAEVAALLGRGRAWVYEHASELGAFRYGTGPKARLGFDRDALERWKRERQIQKPSPGGNTRRRGSRRAVPPRDAALIPYDPRPFQA